MDRIQKLLESSLLNKIPDMILSTFVKKKLNEIGITLKQDKLDELVMKIKNKETIGKFDIEENQVDDLIDKGIISNSHDSLKINLDDSNLFDEIQNTAIESIESLMPSLIEECCDSILSNLKTNMPLVIKRGRRKHRKFEKSVYEKWGEPLGLLELFLHLFLEFGQEFNELYRQSAAANQDFVFEVLIRLHARSCQIGSEILALLKSGLADGAHARWRTLHEINVIASFIAHSGNDTAERYIYHNAVECYKAYKQHRKYEELLGEKPIEEKEAETVAENYNYVIKRFGQDFRYSYGWASPALGKSNPKLSDIEKAIGLDHLRPYYKMASHNVHANPRGAFFRLGLFPEQEDILLAGPSITGLADPAQGAAISLMQIATILLNTKPNMDTLVASRILIKLSDEICQTFVDVQKTLEDEPIGK